MLVLDDAEREALLRVLLHKEGGALVLAADADGLAVEMPSTIACDLRRVVRTRSVIELVAPGSRNGVLVAWDEAKVAGAAVASVVLINGVDASYHFIDLRSLLGVVFAAIVAESAIDLDLVAASLAPVVPRRGRIDKDGSAVIRFADADICQILGFEPGELVGMRSLQLIHPDEQDRAVETWMDMVTRTGGAGTRLRARHRRKDGSWVWMEITNTNQLDTEGRVISEMIDISDEMAALERLRQREQLLARLTEVTTLV